MKLQKTRFERTKQLLLISLMVPSSLFAQAWLSPKGEGTVSLGYQHVYVRDHVDYQGNRLAVGNIHSNVALIDTDYSLTDKFALRVGLPYIAAKYSGPIPHQLPIDDGAYHGTLQDFRINLRYNISQRPAVITPFVEIVIPSHSYEYFAHSAVGRDLREYHAGLNFGRRLDPVLPKAYIQTRYSYAFVESVLNIAPNRSDTDFQFGYFLTPHLSLLGLGSWLHTHNGIDHIGVDPTLNWTAEQYHHHDQLLRTTLLDLGGGVEIALSPSLDLSASVLHSLRGINGHLNAAAVSVGLSWSFRTTRATARASSGVDQGGTAAVVGSVH